MRRHCGGLDGVVSPYFACRERRKIHNGYASQDAPEPAEKCPRALTL